MAVDHNRKVASRILRIFSLANELGFPLGHEYWFVPNTIDSRIPAPKRRVVNAAKMRERQRIFLSKMSIVPSYHIAALDIGLGICHNISLRQAIMAMKSFEFPEMNLFRSVDQNVYEGRVYFVVHKKLLSEANEVVPIIAKIMEIKYGPRVWNWFFNSAKDAVAGYEWSQEQGVFTAEDAILEHNLEKSSLGFMPEDEEEFRKFTVTKNGGTAKKRKAVEQVTFDLIPRGPSKTGNSNDSIGTRQTFSSALSSKQGKRKKTSQPKSSNSTVQSSAATSTLTGSHESISFENIESKILEDEVLFNKLVALFKKISNSPEKTSPRGEAL